MRKFKSLLLVAFLTLGMSGIANAQKIGHVVYERVIANMPETRALQAELAKITKTYKDDIDGMKKKLDDKIKKYTAEQAQQTEDTNKQRAQEVQVDNSRIQQAEQAAYQDIQEKQNNKLVPIIGKARKAISEIGWGSAPSFPRTTVVPPPGAEPSAPDTPGPWAPGLPQASDDGAVAAAAATGHR